MWMHFDSIPTKLYKWHEDKNRMLQKVQRVSNTDYLLTDDVIYTNDFVCHVTVFNSTIINLHELLF